MRKGFNPIFTITNRITAELTRIERARGFLEAATLSEAWVKEMRRRALLPASIGKPRITWSTQPPARQATLRPLRMMCRS